MALLKLDAVQTQRLRMTQNIRQSLDVLQISALELNEIVTQELLENPVLECDDAVGDGFESLEGGVKNDIEGSASSKDDDMGDSSDTGDTRSQGDYTKNAMEIVTQGETLQEHLLSQLRMLTVPQDDVVLLEQLVTCLDENGFLPHKKEEIQKEFAIDKAVLDRLLSIIHTFDPVGCGAEDVAESLLVQARHYYPNDILLHQIIAQYLYSINRYEYEKIAKRLNTKKEEVKEKAALISKLTPYPGAHFINRKSIYVRPDIDVLIKDNEVVITLLADWLPQLYINARYVQMLKQKKVDMKTRDFIHDKVNAAKNFINNISRRNETLLLVAYAIMNRQRDFLQKGQGHLMPLIYADLESELGFHESTIARAVANKYAQTKWGVFELRYFFVKKIQSVHNQETSSDKVLKRLKELIRDEPKQNPLSDEDILDVLNAEGIRIARRTIAKYRDMLSIPASHIRKKSYLIKEEGVYESNNNRQKF